MRDPWLFVVDPWLWFNSVVDPWVWLKSMVKISWLTLSDELKPLRVRLTSFDSGPLLLAKSPCSTVSCNLRQVYQVAKYRCCFVVQEGLRVAGASGAQANFCGAACRQYTLGGSGTPAASYVARDTADRTAKMLAERESYV